MMLPTKQGLVNLYEGNYIVKDGDFYNIYTNHEKWNDTKRIWCQALKLFFFKITNL